MISTTISAGQSLLDVCLQELGTLDALFDLADANGLSITAPLRPGQVLQVPASALSQPQVAAYFSSRQQRINVGAVVGTTHWEPPTDQPLLRAYFHPDFFNTSYFN
jgi:hypothetical protein